MSRPLWKNENQQIITELDLEKKEASPSGARAPDFSAGALVVSTDGIK